jgi:hypothetical protein
LISKRIKEFCPYLYSLNWVDEITEANYLNINMLSVGSLIISFDKNTRLYSEILSFYETNKNLFIYVGFSTYGRYIVNNIGTFNVRLNLEDEILKLNFYEEKAILNFLNLIQVPFIKPIDEDTRNTIKEVKKRNAIIELVSQKMLP